MVRIEETVEIAAPRERVWQISVDVERWPEWARNFRDVRRLDAGAFGPQSSARIRQRGIPATTWRVASFDDGHAFSWRGRLFPGLWSTGTHLVEPADGGTSVTLGVELSGPLAPLFAGIARRALRVEAADLKARAEGGP
jgi:uncharacterized membrane protein